MEGNFNPDIPLHDLLRLQATKSPDVIALEDISGFSMTYTGLADSVDLWARLFSAAGFIVSGQKVPVFLNKSANILRRTNGPDSVAGGLITILLAIMRAGGVFIPIEPAYPSQRIEKMLEHVQDKGPVLTTSDLVPNLPTGTKHVCIDTLDVSAILAANPKIESMVTLPNISAHDPAYVIFTSGTTGVPKVILVSHRAVSQCAIAQRSFLELDSDSITHRVLQLSNYIFDACFWDIFVAFAHGYTLCIADQRTIFSELPRVISALRISIIHTTPTVIQNFLLSDDQEHDLSSLKIICVGGESMKPHVKNVWQDRVRLFNCYGPSEYYICLGKRMAPNVSTNNIGRPFGNNRAYVLKMLPDGNLQKVSPGDEGELYLAGPQISFGYINDIEATKRTFLDDPFVPGERMYKTGDQVWLSEHGFDILFGGRQDGQIKLRGIRMEVDEIEGVIQSHPRVRAVAIDKITIEGEPDQLGAFICLHSNSSSDDEDIVRIQTAEEIPEASATVENLRLILLEKLPEAMTPSLWIPISRLPFNASGKLDRHHLRALIAVFPMDSIRATSRRLLGTVGNRTGSGEEDATKDTSTHRGHETWTPTQTMLRASWSKALAIPPENIGLDDAFHRLGGDSITSIRLSALIRRQGYALSSAHILSKYSIRLQSEIIDQERASLQAKTSLEESTARTLSSTGPVRLSPVQQRYFEHTGFEEPALDFFNQSMLLQVNKTFAPDKLHSNLVDVVGRHPILKSIFRKDSSGHWLSEVPEGTDAHIKVLFRDLGSSRDPVFISAELDALSKSLDPRRGVNVAACVFTGQTTSHEDVQALFITINHWVVDLVSWRIILEELELALSGHAISGEEDSLSFRGWMDAMWTEAQELGKDHWPLSLPASSNIWKANLSHADLRYASFRTEISILDHETTDTLLADATHVPFSTEPLDILLAAFSVSLSTISNLSAISVALEGHGREPQENRVNLASTVGWFTSVFPVVLEVDSNLPLEVAIARVKDTRRAIPRKGLSYGMARYLAKQDLPAKHAVHVPIAFNYRGRFQQLEGDNALFTEFRPKDVHWRDFGDNVVSPCSLQIDAYHYDGRLEIHFEYSPQVYSDSEIIRLATSWRMTVEKMVARLGQLGKEFGVRLTNTDVPLLSASVQTFEHLSTSFESLAERSWSQIDKAFPCTPMQTSMLALTVSDPDFFMTQLVFHLDPHTEEHRLRTAFNQLLQRNDSLRSVFVMPGISGLPTILQLVLKPAFALPVWVIKDVPNETDLPAALQSYLDADRSLGFPLGKFSVRCAVFRVRGVLSRFIVTLHHAQFDGWSYQLLLEDLTFLYSNQEEKLSPTVPYESYVEWLQKQDVGTALKYWDSKLEGAEILDFPRVNSADIAAVKSSVVINREWQGDLSEFCKSYGVTTAAVVRAALAVVLSRICGVDDVLYVSVTSGRSGHQIAAIDHVRGTCIVTVPTRVSLDPEDSCIHVIQQIMLDQDDQTPHEWIGLKEILDNRPLGSERQIPQVLLAFQNYTSPDIASDASFKLIHHTEPPRSSQNCAITLFIFPKDEHHLTVDCEYDPNVVSEHEASWLTRHLCNTLSAIMAAPETKVKNINLITQDESALLLSLPSRAAAVELDSNTLHGVFEAQVNRVPEKSAIETDTGEIVSYRQLDKQATAFANKLRRRISDCHGQVIGLLVGRSIQAVVAMLAILKAGAAFAPLDPLSPAERNVVMLKDLNVTVLVTVHGLEETCPTTSDIRRIYVDEQLHEDEQLFSMANRVEVDIPAYVMHTSGSTGKPKAIMFEHRHAVAYIANSSLALPLDMSSRVLSIARFTNDACIEEIFRPLAFGATICLPTDITAWAQLPLHIKSLRATHITITPTVLALVGEPNFPHLKVVNLMGEASSTDLRKLWADHVKLFETYGPTETTVLAVVKRWTPDNLDNPYIGVPFGNNRLYVLDANLRPSPVNCIGELCISGNQVARGYINRLSDNAFTADPFVPGDRIYRTGDFARWTEFGIIFLGRKDGQTKINGIRVELEEVEANLRARFPLNHLELVVDRIRTSKRETKLVAIIAKARSVMKPNDDIVLLNVDTMGIQSRNQIHAFQRSLLASLPSHMVPTYWTIVETIPMTTTSKTHRGRIRKFLEDCGIVLLQEKSRALLSEDNASTDHLISLPTVTEIVIAEAWVHVLPDCSREKVSLRESWWSYGGDSISIMRLALYLRERGFRLQMADLLRHATISAQAEREDELALKDKIGPGSSLNLLSSGRGGEISGAVTPGTTSTLVGSHSKKPSLGQTSLEAVVVPSPFEEREQSADEIWSSVSLAQERLWFLDQLYPTASAYSMPSALLIEGLLNRHALELTLKQITYRHQPLRTLFRNINGHPRSNVLRLDSFRLTETHLPSEGFDVAILDDFAMGIMREHAKIPFRLSEKPGWICHLIKVSDTRHWLFINMHHIIADGWSWGIILNEISSTYLANVNDLPNLLPPLKLHFNDYARDQQNSYSSGILDLQLKGLVKHLQGYTPAEFPLDMIRPTSLSFVGGLHTFYLSMETLASLEELSKHSSATLYMTLLAAFRILHFRYTGVEDAVIGSPIAGRTVPGTEELIGFFVNTLVVRIPVNAKATLASVLSETRLAALTAYEYSEVPFLKLVSEMQPKRDLSRNPIVQVVLALQLDQVSDFEVGDVSFSRREVHITTRVDMELHFRRTGNGLKCDIIYSSSLFHHDTIRDLANNLSDVIDSMLRTPNATVEEIPFLHSLDQLTHAQVPLRAPLIANPRGSIVQHFKAAAADHRDLIALLDENVTFTYHEVDRLSDILAQKISKMAETEPSHDVVAFCIPPSALAILTILGILKHGAAYLPLDVRLPDARLHAMLSDSKASVLITTNASPLISLVDSNVHCLDVTKFLVDWRKHFGLHTSDIPPDIPSSSANELAYVLYTSGSTGKPKGVAVTQQSVLALVSNKEPLAFRPGYRVAQTTNLAFDPSTIEIWGALLSGATLICFNRNDVLDPMLLAHRFNSYRIDFCIMSGAFFRHILDLAPQLFKTLHTLMLGGESVHYGSIRKVYDQNPTIIIRNAYGPTEATVLATSFTIYDQNDVCEYGQVPIGRPTTTCQALVLDGLGRLVPPGVIGELFIGGEGVSNGYLGDPTNPSFTEISVDELAQPPAKFYRSGDIVRWRSDGQLEFVGRRSIGQVKIRGQRLEIGEVESAIIQTGLVNDAAVISHKSSPDADPILVAYVVSNARNAESILTEAAILVENWKNVYDDVYGSYDMNEARLEFLGWDSMITNTPIPRPEMEAWMEDTLQPFFVRRPRNVFEIGCGVGIFLYKMEPVVERMWAIEPSIEAVNHIKTQLMATNLQSKVKIWQSTADRINELPSFKSEFILMNSVVQYFPSEDYLQEVILQMIKRCDVDSQILIGDVRSLPLDEYLGIDIILHGWNSELAQHTIDDLRDSLRVRKTHGAELLVDPSFFAHLKTMDPSISHVEILPKVLEAANELSQFRYQVLLHIRGSTTAIVPDTWFDYEQLCWNLDSLESAVRAFALGEEEVLAVEHIPNKLLSWERKAHSFIFASHSDPKADLTTLPSHEISPNDGWTAWEIKKLAEKLGVNVRLSFARQSETPALDAAFIKKRTGGGVPLISFKNCYVARAPYRGFCSKPPQKIVNEEHELSSKILERLQIVLPSFMLPEVVHHINNLPLTVNGKLDRRQLEIKAVSVLEKTLGLSATRPVEAPEDDIEMRLCKIFEEMLSRRLISRSSDFFANGGHSLLATRLKSQIEKHFKIPFTLQDVFNLPTPKQIANKIRETYSNSTLRNLPVPILVGKRDEYRSLSFAQERLWFLDQLYPGNRMYHIPLVYKLEGELDEKKLQVSIEEIAGRHEVLRSIFVDVQGIPKQKVLSVLPMLLRVDLSHREVDASRIDAAIRRVVDKPFKFEEEPAFRATLFKLGTTKHILAFSMHHIISDGWSMDLLRNELVQIYSALTAGANHVLPVPKIQYSDFAEWQRSDHFEIELRRQADYWQTQLTGSKPAEFPADCPRPALLSEKADHYEIICGKELADRLEVLCRATNTTMFMVLMTAFRVLHYRLTGDEDASFGSPIANRHHQEIEKTIGFFTNTQVIRIKVTPGQDFMTLVQSVRQVALGAFENQDMPFEKIVSLLQPVRDSSRNPVIQTILAYQTVDYHEPFSFSGIDASILELDHRTRFDLQVHFSSTSQGLKGLFVYSTDLFSPSTMKHYAETMRTILEEVAQNPKSSVDTLYLGPPALLQPESVSYLPQTLQELFCASASRNPDVIALQHGERYWTYQQLDRCTNAIALDLLNRFGSGLTGHADLKTVGVFIDNSAWTVIAMLSILKAGWAYIPIDIRQPEERMYTMLAEAGSNIVLLSRENSPPLEMPDVESYFVDDFDQTPATDLQVILPLRKCDDLACIIFTSGSTGTPKGILIEHRSIVRIVCDDALLPLGLGSRMAQVSNLGFDPSGLEIWGALCRGATLICYSHMEVLDVEGLSERFQRDSVDSAHLPTPMFAYALEHVPSLLQHLTLLLVGGEAMTKHHLALFDHMDTDAILINAYGPAENGIVSTFYRHHPAQVLPRSVVVGKPVLGTAVAIIDDSLCPVPEGVMGEICVFGAGLARGYVRLVQPNPFLQVEVAGAPTAAYRTGDLGRLWKGQLEYLSRRDTQVKIRGQRIEIGEIEQNILNSDEFSEAVVVVQVNTQGDKQLVAYATAKPAMSQATSASALLRFLAQKLPKFMIPAAIHVTEKLPLTANGKVDRRALSAIPFFPASVDSETLLSEREPKNPLETIVLDAYTQVLGLEGRPHINLDDSFFDLGGHSLLLTQLVALLRSADERTSHASLPLVFENTTPRLLAARLSKTSGISVLPELSIENVRAKDPSRTIFPASGIMKRFWMLQEFFSDSTYSLPSYRQTTGLSLDVVEQEFSLLCREHSIFRTNLVMSSDGELQQHISDQFIPKAHIIDLRSCPDAEARMQSVITKDVCTPFDLSAGPLIRLICFDLDDDVQLLHLNVHHCIADMTSTVLFWNTLLERTRAFMRDGKRDPSLIQNTDKLEYVDFTMDQIARMNSPATKDTLVSYWQRQLSGVEPLSLPTLRAPLAAGITGGMVEYSDSFQVPTTFEKFCTQHGASDFSGFLAVIQTLLARYSSSADFGILVPMSVRNHTATRQMFGCFLETAILRNQAQSHKTFAEVVTDTVRTIAAGMQNLDMTFEEVLYVSAWKKEAFPVMFVYLVKSSEQNDIESIPFALPNPPSAAKFPLTIVIERQLAEVKCTINFNSASIASNFAFSIGSHVKKLIESIIADLELPIPTASQAVGQLDILSDDEIEKINAALRTVKDWDDRRATVNDLLRCRFSKIPEKVACNFEGTMSITYRELDIRVGQIAQALHRSGVVPEATIAVLMDASIELIVAILAIVRSGAAYVPLDPSHPTNRLGFIIANSDAKLVISSPEYKVKLDLEEWSDVEVTDLDSLQRKGEGDEFQSELTEANLCYILYTSGSTGQPKGVQVQHRSLVHAIHEHTKIYELTSDSKLLQFAAYTFDVSVIDIFATLACGATLCLGRKGFLLADLASAIRAMKVTHIATTPTVISLLDPEQVPTLKVLAIGGEPMTKAVRDTWAGERNLKNVYGPTECTVNVISRPMTIETPISSIGKPLGGVQAHIINEYMCQAPIGVVGQLAISGPQVSRGYLNNPEASKAFVYDKSSGARLYLTGDLARLGFDGNIECLGRMDGQIKLRGLRIELGEIDAAIASHTTVTAGTTLLLKTKNQGEALVAFIVPQSSTATIRGGDDSINLLLTMHSDLKDQAMNLRSHLLTTLPEYFIPTYWLPLRSLPTNVNGKVDKKVLSSLFYDLDESTLWDYTCDTDFKPSVATPQRDFLSEKELILSSIWSQVLGLESGAIPVDVSFFSLGGDSISAIRLAAKVRQQALAMNPKDIYSYPTIRALAKAIELQTSKPGARDETSQDLPIGVFSPTPVLRWFLTQREDLSWYNMTFTVKTTRSLEPEVVRQCWLRLVQHHDCLRLRILDDNVAQIMPADHAEASMLITIMNSVDEAAVHGSIREMQASLDPRTGVISALGVFNIQSAGQLIFMSVHHAAVDLVSWRIIFADMENMINGEGPPTKTLSYRGWSNHLSARHPQTSQAIAMPVPVDMNHYLSDRNTYETSERLSASLPIQIVVDLTRANETYRTETVDLLLASFLLAWTKWAATDHLSVLFESHGRFDDECDVDITSTVGWFTNLFDLTFSLADKRNNAHLISQAICIVKEQRHNTGWRTLVHRHVPGRGNVTFNYTSGFQELESSSLFQPVELPHEGWQVNPSSERSSVLDVTAVIRGGELDLGILYSCNLHRKSTIERLLELWQGCLIDIINHCKAASPTLTPSDVPLLHAEEDELQRVLLEIAQNTDTVVKDIETILPCTDMQTSMLLASQCSDVYMEYFDYTIAGTDLTFEKLQTAWRTVAQRHCLLRSTWIDKSGVKDGNSLVLVVWKTYPEISSWTNDLRTRSCNPGTPLSQVFFDRLGPGNFRMQWAIHHAIVDGWSTRLIMHDFQQAYDGNLLDTYGDFQVYLKYRQVSSMPQRSIDFWKTYLAGLTPTVLLDPAVKRSSSASISVSEVVDIPYARILNRSKAHGITVSTLLRAALALTLSRYVQQDDVFFGVVVSGRNAPIPGIEQIVGPLINTQPFRVTVGPTGRLVDLLQDVDQNSKELIHHEQDSLHSVLRIINQSSDLLQVLLVYQNYPTLSSSEDRQIKPFTMQAVKQVETTDVPFCIVAGTLGDKLHLQALARTTNFTPFFAKNFLLSLSSTIQSFAIDTEQVSTHVSSLHPRQSELLRQWSNVDLPFPIKPLPLFDLVQRSALLHHELVAVEEIETSKSITYHSLVHQARVLAIKLVQEGLKPRDVIAIQMDKSINMVVAVLAATLLGAYVPIDMDAPAERKANILKESNAKIILVDNIVIENQNTTADSYVKSLAIGPLLAVTAVGDSMDLQMSASPNDTAYILFTSGSTGKPKGVEIQHQAASTYVENMKRSYGYTPGQKVFGFARLTFDISVTDIFSSLSAGATLCLASQQATMDDLNAVIRRGQVQSVNLTPTVASLLNPEAVPSLKTLILAGEAARRDIILRWARYVTVLNSSGPTEAAVTTVSRLVEESDPRNVGKAVPGVQVYVLDRSLRPTPPGAIGRVFFGGIQLARGYINRPDLTCSVFVDNPISGGIMYDSGDLGAYDEGGNLLHLGRSDGQVKINGQRVELQEIEAVFNEANVSDAEVVISISKKGTPNQKLFGLLHTKLRPSPTNYDPEVLLALKSLLVKHANKYIPGYMIPSIWVYADTVPRTTSGKIDRRSIVAQFEAGIYNELSNTFPGRITGRQTLTPVGRLLLRCLQDVLGDISKDLDLSEDIFSHYGLDSFGSMRLVSMLRQKISRDIHLQWIIDGRTFENIIAKLETTISGIEDVDAENLHDAPATAQDQDKFNIPSIVYFSQVTSVPFLFCIHPASGLAFQFAALSRITSAFNVVALNDPDFASNLDDDKHNTIPKRAVGYYEHIVEALAAIAPDSKEKLSMNIMGYSFGGHLGVEVARLARRDGWNVNLFVIDSAVHNQGWDTTKGAPPSTITDTQVDAVLGEFDIPDARSSLVSDDTAEYHEWRSHLRHQVRRNLRALMRYTMEPYAGHLTLFRAEENKQHGYQERVASLDDIVLRGTHFHLLDEPIGNLPELAKKTSDLITSSML